MNREDDRISTISVRVSDRERLRKLRSVPVKSRARSSRRTFIESYAQVFKRAVDALEIVEALNEKRWEKDLPNKNPNRKYMI